MIRTRLPSAAIFAARLAARAGVLARARIERRQRRGDDAAGRTARLLWPLFTTKD